MTRHVLVTCDGCGHRGDYKTLELAEFHFPRHSCELVQERRAAFERKLGRLAAEGERRDCQCKRVRHEHGDRVMYIIDKCRCHACKVAQRTYEQERRRAAAYGRTNRVDAGPVRAHLRALMDAGMGWMRIADQAGISRSTCGTILYGRGSAEPRDRRPPRKTVERATADKILAVTLDLAGGIRISPVGTTRRVQALVAVGWSMSKIAAAIGMQPGNFTGVAHGRRDVTVRTAAAITDLYDRWWDQKPDTGDRFEMTAYRRALKYAAEHNWPPPLAWDDDTIDDPNAQPIEAPVPIHRGPRGSVHPDDVEWLVESGAALPEILHRLGVTKNTLEITLKRYGRGDVWQRVSERHRLRSTAPRRVA